jgi:hypothetical protein
MTTLDGGTSKVTNPDALQCALEALRDGTPGILSEYSNSSSPFNSSSALTVVAGRIALSEIYRTLDVFGSGARKGPSPLRPASYFANCLLDPSDTARLACFDDAVIPCQP